MEPMTLDEAKAATMRIETYRSELSRTYAEGIAVVLADALRDAGAQVAALTAKLATARADAIEEAAKIADEWATAMGRAEVCAFDFATLAKEIRTLAPAPEAPPMPIVRFNPAGDVWLDHGDAPSAPPPGSTPVRSADGSTTWQRPPAPEAKAETPPANERPPANPPRHYADAAFDGAPHYDPTTPPPFDARKAFQQLAIELQVDDRDFTDMRAMVAAALAPKPPAEPRAAEAPFDAPLATPPAETRPLDRALRAGMKAIVEAHPTGSPSCDEPLTAQQLHDVFAIMLEAGYSRLDGNDSVG